MPYSEPEQEYHRVIVKLASKYAPAKAHIMDFGCGLGYILNLLRTALPNAVLYGADIDQNCLEITKDRVKDVNTVLLQEESGFAGAPESYDICILSHVLEHLPEPKRSIQQILETIKPGGYLIIAVPNIVRPDIIMDNIRRRHYVNRGHVCAWDRSHWINFLENICNLDVVEYSQDLCPFFLRRFGKSTIIKRLEKSSVKWLPWLSMSHISVIKK